VLLTGARRRELAGLRHDQIDYRWDEATLADKVENTRQVPLTPHLKALLTSLPKAPNNPFVFPAARSASGHIAEPRSVLDRVLQRSGIPHVSVHGLRRSFALLAEAAGVGAAGAQVMGHRPSATHEKYRPRQMDLLGEYLGRIQDFILSKAGVHDLKDFGCGSPSKPASPRKCPRTSKLLKVLES
jgi:integrase